VFPGGEFLVENGGVFLSPSIPASTPRGGNSFGGKHYRENYLGL